MARIMCPHCLELIDSRATRCSHCGGQVRHVDDELDDMSQRSGTLAFDAAGRLNTVATIILVLLSLFAVVSAGVGTAVLVRADNSTDRWYGAGVIGGSVLAWLSVALTCFACQAIARYIEFRVDEAD